jgi:hypothetical protein
MPAFSQDPDLARTQQQLLEALTALRVSEVAFILHTCLARLEVLDYEPAPENRSQEVLHRALPSLENEVDAQWVLEACLETLRGNKATLPRPPVTSQGPSKTIWDHLDESV